MRRRQAGNSKAVNWCVKFVNLRELIDRRDLDSDAVIVVVNEREISRGKQISQTQLFAAPLLPFPFPFHHPTTALSITV